MTKESISLKRELLFEDFVTCFRKQFAFQKRSDSPRAGSRYFTDYNYEQGMKTNTWGMLTFIHTGAYYGFTHDTLRQELHIPINLYNDLKEEVEKILQADYPDQPLRNKVLTKSGLVMNCVRAWYRI